MINQRKTSRKIGVLKVSVRIISLLLLLCLAYNFYCFLYFWSNPTQEGISLLYRLHFADSLHLAPLLALAYIPGVVLMVVKRPINLETIFHIFLGSAMIVMVGGITIFFCCLMMVTNPAALG